MRVRVRVTNQPSWHLHQSCECVCLCLHSIKYVSVVSTATTIQPFVVPERRVTLVRLSVLLVMCSVGMGTSTLATGRKWSACIIYLIRLDKTPRGKDIYCGIKSSIHILRDMKKDFEKSYRPTQSNKRNSVIMN